MVGHGSTAVLQPESSLEIDQTAGYLAKGNKHGTLILDRVGRIRSFGSAAKEMFGPHNSALNMQRMLCFIADLFGCDHSPSYNARYLAYLCNSREWRKFEATDTSGREFDVELRLSRMTMDGQDIFILNLRRPEETFSH